MEKGSRDGVEKDGGVGVEKVGRDESWGVEVVLEGRKDVVLVISEGVEEREKD